MRVLIVEDDPALGLFLRRSLAGEGHDTEWVSDGLAALPSARVHDPEVIILDLSLPKRDGVDVLADIRHWSALPAVVVLTARNDVEERVRCFQLGADDCVLKPFHFHELMARCYAAVRRSSVAPGLSSTLTHGNLEMDLLRRKVWRDGAPIALTGKEFSLLEYLMRRQGQCCTREALLRDLWQVRADSVTNVVDVYVNYLRKKLAVSAYEDASGKALIETVRGAGYRLASVH